MRPSGFAALSYGQDPRPRGFLQSTPKNWGREACLKIFNIYKRQLQAKGYMGKVFVDASHLISKANLCEERDEVSTVNKVL